MYLFSLVVVVCFVFGKKFFNVFNLFGDYLLNICNMPGSVPDTGDSAVNRPWYKSLGNLQTFEGCRQVKR